MSSTNYIRKNSVEFSIQIETFWLFYKWYRSFRR